MPSSGPQHSNNFPEESLHRLSALALASFREGWSLDTLGLFVSARSATKHRDSSQQVKNTLSYFRGVLSLPTKESPGSLLHNNRRFVSSRQLAAHTLAEAGASSGWEKEARESITLLRYTSSRTIRINLLYNFIFEADGIRSWRAYGIGEGKLQRYSNAGTVASDSMKIVVLQPFTFQQSSRTISVGAEATFSADIFPCDEPSYVLTFSTEEAVEQYMTLGRH